MKKKKRNKYQNFPIDLSDNAINATLSIINDDNYNKGIKSLKNGMQSAIIDVENGNGVDKAMMIELI